MLPTLIRPHLGGTSALHRHVGGGIWVTTSSRKMHNLAADCLECREHKVSISNSWKSCRPSTPAPTISCRYATFHGEQAPPLHHSANLYTGPPADPESGAPMGLEEQTSRPPHHGLSCWPPYYLRTEPRVPSPYPAKPLVGIRQSIFTGDNRERKKGQRKWTGTVRLHGDLHR